MPSVAAIQMNSVDDVDANLARAGELIAEAAGRGCALAALPENFALMPRRGRDKARVAEQVGAGPIQAFLAETAKRHKIWIVGGSIPLASADPERVFGACPVVDDTGSTRAIYRKIHLFDVDLRDAGESYRESNSMVAGEDPVVVATPAGQLGLSICYDVRFPELFRGLVGRGATLFTVPSAFTEVTGRAHWHVLLRARAVENLAYVIAPGQTGTHPDSRATYGHSLIVDPWGVVVGELPEGEGCVVAEVDPEHVARLRQEFPALTNRRLN
jgi:predicted amidohydrolase